MKIVAPSSALAPFVREMMIVDVREEVTHVRLPEPGLVLGVRYAGAASVLAGETATQLPDVSLAGMTGTARRMRTAAGGGVVLARFQPGGAAAFFATPLHELFGATLSLDALVPATDVDRLRTQVSEAATEAARVAALDAFLVARLRPETDDVVAAAVRLLDDARGALPIRALARHLAISQDPLEKRFRRVVGASPKQFASLLRLRRALESYRPGASLAALALDAGYYDQSHFNRELRAVTGEPPGRFLRAGVYR
ncbi:MAG TPA: helix-turn-helix domain-containing protein [Polyangia bacterium]|nr:helix-turn-helix domain-containing protein [Polyangia bacterium]